MGNRSERVFVNLEPGEKRRLEALARADDRSVASLLRIAVRWLVDGRPDVPASYGDVTDATKRAIAADRARRRD